SPRPTATASAAAPAASASAAAPTASATASAAPAPTAAPAPGSADAVAVAIDQVFLDKKTFFAKFKQEHTQKVAGTTKKSTGVFYFERPNKISFRYDPPSKNRIVSDGTTLKVYIGEDNQMFVQPVDKTEYPGALAFLMGKGLGPSFSFSFNDKTKFEGGPVLLGKPRQATPHYDSVYFYVDKALLEKKDPGVIRRVLLVDAQGNRNRFDFEGSTQPATIDPAEFTFTPPPGTNVTQN
ncbi:outer membrane lipoprotein carrier protein LolA, partial [Polyangium sp. y55x31]|uniref:LolA family protein n=1 Tax=Polyangium sp. y55x31 TaxID=3042688 RepID=UPI002482A891